MSYNQTQGLAGESQAEKFLRRNGYKILERRYRSRFGEIDLIALKQKGLYFIEVKWRKTKEFGDPLEAVTPQKIRHLKKAACCFLQDNPGFQKWPTLELAAIAIRDYDEKNPIEMVLIRP